MKIVSFGDVHMATRNLERMSEVLRDTDLVIVSGDLTNFGGVEDARKDLHEALDGWLKPGWQDFDGRVDIHTSQNVSDKEGKTNIELFEEVPLRDSRLKQWQKEREIWKTNERPGHQVLAIFQTIYEWLGIHEREAERIEILVGDGILSCPDDDGNFDHPVLLQRVELEFLPEKRHPQFIFRKREQQPELYLEFLRALPDANQRQIARCAEELKRIELSPLGGADTEGFLRRLIQSLFPTGGHLLTEAEQHQGADPTIRRDPVIFIRQRRSGSGNMFDLVLVWIGRRAFPWAYEQERR